MSDPTTGSDSLRLYRTIRAADGAPGSAQPDPALSLGGARSATPAGRPGFLVSGSMTGVRVDDLVGPLGVATIRAASADALALALPGDDEGEAVEVAVGQTRVLRSATGHAVVQRVLDEPLAGAMTLRLVPAMHNAIAMADLADADRQAGLTIYRAVLLRHPGLDHPLRDVRFWFTANPGNRWALGLDAVDGDGLVQELASETDAPVDVDFHQPSAPGDDLRIEQLDPQAMHGLFIRRTSPAGDEASPRVSVAIAAQYQTRIPE